MNSAQRAGASRGRGCRLVDGGGSGRILHAVHSLAAPPAGLAAPEKYLPKPTETAGNRRYSTESAGCWR